MTPRTAVGLSVLALVVVWASTSGPLAASGAVGPLAHESARHRIDNIIVKFADDLSEVEKALILDRYGCWVLRTCEPGRFYQIGIPPDCTPQTMVLCFEGEAAVEYAELNHVVGIFFEPNDPYYVYQWHLDNDLTGGINAGKAWRLQQGDPNVVVAVLDTGVAYEDYGGFRMAPDLAEALFVPGYDFVNDDEHPNDDSGHGTHVAGTIAQSTDNRLGVAGVAFGCAVMPVKVLDSDGQGDHFSISQGIYFATNYGAHVINMSFGSPGDSRTLRDAVAYADRSGVTLVGAAGNAYLAGNAPSYPAAYEDYCIAVGAVRYDDTRAYYSNTGPHLDLMAPGGDLTVDQNHDGYPDGILQQAFSVDLTEFNYFFFQGTSMAAAHVSGVAALLVSRGVTRPDKVRQAMELTARDVGPEGWDAQYGWGVVDAYAALAYQVPGDVDGDNVVDAPDLLALCDTWLHIGRAVPADFNADGIVDFQDFAVLASNWPN